MTCKAPHLFTGRTATAQLLLLQLSGAGGSLMMAGGLVCSSGKWVKTGNDSADHHQRPINTRQAADVHCTPPLGCLCICIAPYNFADVSCTPDPAVLLPLAFWLAAGVGDQPCCITALVFQGVGFFDVGLAVFTGRLGWLADCIVPCGPKQGSRSKQDWVQLLQRRLQPVKPVKSG